MVVSGDEQLLATLDASIVAHVRGASTARKDRRQVWLRMFEDGAPYARLMSLSHVSRAVMHAELRRARTERADEGDDRASTSRA